MPTIHHDAEVVTVEGRDQTLTYRPREVTLSDGTVVRHDSLGGTLSSVWAADLGDVFVEVVHVGHGPEGGELVLVVQSEDVVALGDLYVAETPATTTPGWPVAVDIALGLMLEGTRVLTSDGEVTREDVEHLHQRLLGVLHG